MKVNMTNALILDRHGRALLIHNCKNSQDRWEFPGGKVEKEDKRKLERTVKRELKEEAGIEIKILGIFGDYKTHTPEGEFLCRTYHAEIIEGIPKIMELDKADELRYLSYEELEKLKRQGNLAQNLASALPKLKEYMG